MPGRPDVGVDVDHASAEIAACKAVYGAALELAPCLSVGLERVTARGTGPGVSARSAQSTSVVVGVAGAAHFQVLENMALFALAGAGVPSSRPRLVLDGLGEVGQLGSLQISLALGTEWIF